MVASSTVKETSEPSPSMSNLTLVMEAVAPFASTGPMWTLVPPLSPVTLMLVWVMEGVTFSIVCVAPVILSTPVVFSSPIWIVPVPFISILLLGFIRFGTASISLAMSVSRAANTSPSLTDLFVSTTSASIPAVASAALTCCTSSNAAKAVPVPTSSRRVLMIFFVVVMISIVCVATSGSLRFRNRYLLRLGSETKRARAAEYITYSLLMSKLI